MSRSAVYSVWLSDVTRVDAGIVGNKAAMLGDLLSQGLPVPEGFCVTNSAFRCFLRYNDLGSALILMYRRLDTNSASAESAPRLMREELLAGSIPSGVKQALRAPWVTLSDSGSIPLALRSSASVEDLPCSSAAGQYDTYLNVKGFADFLAGLKKCWASLFNDRALEYSRSRGTSRSLGSMAVLVEKMIVPEKAGVVFTEHPVSHKKVIVIEGSWGFGEAIVSGKVTPDMYVVDRRTGRVMSIEVKNKKRMVAMDNGDLREMSVPRMLQKKESLSRAEVEQLRRYSMRIEKHFGEPQDIEWAISGGKVQILQSRPITGLKKWN